MRAHTITRFAVRTIAASLLLAPALADPVEAHARGRQPVAWRSADLNGDGVVNLRDFRLVLQQMGQRCSKRRTSLSADLNRDCRVNGRDLRRVLELLHDARRNAAPTATPDSVTTNEDESASVAVLANDVDRDGDLLRIVSVTQGVLGSTAVGAGGVITYTPAPNANGLDKFLYTVSDGRGGSATAAVSVRVRAVNDAPVVTIVATPSAGVAPLTVQFTATASDPDGDTITFAWDFGDGTFGTGSDTSHTYSSAGTFNAEVVVTDGATSSEAGQTVSATTPSGPSTFVVQTVAGTGTFGGAGAGGPAVLAQLADPRRVAVTPDGALYIVDLTRILRVDASGTLATLRTFSSADEGPSLAVGPDGALYYTEADVVGACTEGGFYGEVRVRRLTEDGSDPVAAAWTNTAAVGSCLPSARLAIDGTGEFYLGVGYYLVKLAAGSTDAAWQVPVMGNVYALAGAPAGGAYVGTFAGILLVQPDSSSTIVAGVGAHGSGGDGGPAVAALVAAVGGLAVRADGSLTFLEYDFTTGLPRVRAIAPDGTISTIGGGQAGFNGDGLAALATAFAFADSAGLAADGGGGFYVADVSNQRVRRLAPVTP